MRNHLKFFATKQIPHRRLISKIGMMNGHIFGETGDVCMLDSRIVKIIEVIDDGDFVPGREQVFNEMGADKTCPASDQNSHGARSSTTKHKKCTKKIMIAWHSSASVSNAWRFVEPPHYSKIAPVYQQINPV